MTWLRQTLEASRQTGFLIVRHRLVLLLAILAVVVAAVSVFVPQRVVREFTGDDLFGFPTYLLVFQFGLPTVFSYLGLWAVHDEIVDRSAIYVFAQPVSRVSLMVGKWLAVAAFGAVATAAACTLYWLALALPDRAWRRGLGPEPETLRAFVDAGALAAPGYAAVGAFCGAAFKRPLIAAILFVVGWEVAVSNVPPQAGVRGWTVADPVRRYLLDAIDPPANSGLSELLQLSLAGGDAGRLGDPVASVTWFTLVFLAAAAIVYTRREYDARARD